MGNKDKPVRPARTIAKKIPNSIARPPPSNRVPIVVSSAKPGPPRPEFWLVGLPDSIGEPVLKRFTENAGWPMLFRQVIALTDVASMSIMPILKIREEAGQPGKMKPEVFGHNVTFTLRYGRDEVLKALPVEYRAMATPRVERLIDFTREALEAFQSVPVDQIVCRNPKCRHRGQHLLPGPWVQAERRLSDAVQDVFTLLRLSDSSPAGSYDSNQLSPACRRLWDALADQVVHPEELVADGLAPTVGALKTLATQVRRLFRNAGAIRSVARVGMYRPDRPPVRFPEPGQRRSGYRAT